MSVKRILVIAGSDSSGGAGLEADQKVIAAHGCYAMTATTALTAQNTQDVYGIHCTPADFVKQQIDVCIEDIGVHVVKTGMLASAETISVVANAIQRHNVPCTVVDPVMVSTSGAQLLPEQAIDILLIKLLPITTILTPNIPEAVLLLKRANVAYQNLQEADDFITMAKLVQKLGPEYVLLKGGHTPLDKSRRVSKDSSDRSFILNVLAGPDDATITFETEYLPSKNTHGTGCSLASAIACNIASGLSIQASVKAATNYIEAGIKTSQKIGKGSGPINHFHSTYTLPFAPGKFIDYLLSRPDVQPSWQAHTHHPFVKALSLGTLPLSSFKTYLIQDYLFLLQYTRAHALSAYKAKTPHDAQTAARIITHIASETKLHLDYCAQEFNLQIEDVVCQEEKQACTAYTRYVLDVGHAEDWFALQVCMLPCLLGYGVIAKRLFDDPNTVREGNLYWRWVLNYVGDDYVDAVRIGCDLIEKHAVNQSPSRIEELVKIFIHATKMETGFWDMGSEA